MFDLSTLTTDTFRPHAGTNFTVVVSENESIELTLDKVTETATQLPGMRRGFTLEFKGGAISRILPQAIYLFRHAELGDFELFIVPRAPVGGVPRYDADFS